VFAFSGDAAAIKPEQSDESHAAPHQPVAGDCLAVLPGWTSTVLLRNGPQTIAATLLGGAAVEFAAPDNTDEFNRRQSLVLLAGQVVLNTGSGEPRFEVLYRGPDRRPQKLTVRFGNPARPAGVEIIRGASRAAPPQLKVHSAEPPRAPASSGAGISLAGPPRLPAWVTSATVPEASPLEGILESAGMQPGVQPLTRELRLELQERLRAALEEIESDIERNKKRRPSTTSRGRAAQLKAAQLRADQHRLIGESLALLDEVPVSQAADSRNPAEPEAREPSDAEGEAAPKTDQQPPDSESQAALERPR
jgi:hypothetical protein